MKRHTAIRVCLKALQEDDIAIVLGEDLQIEALKYERENNIYLPNRDYMLSVALGIAMTTKRKVCVFCEESYFIRNLSELMQIAISKLENISLFLLCPGVYTALKGAPTPFDNVGSKQGILYNMGFLVHNYTNHFNLSSPVKELSKVFKNTRGPLAAVINIEPVVSKVDEFEIDYEKSIKKVRELSNCLED